MTDSTHDPQTCLACSTEDHEWRHPFIQDTIRTVKAHGWAVLMIGPDVDVPQFAYSAGALHAIVGQPEIVVFGLAPETSKALINTALERVRSTDVPLPLDTPVDAIAEVPVVFKQVRPEATARHLHAAANLYGVESVPAIQLVWPDTNGRFPWERRFDRTLGRLQPALWR